MFFFCRVGAWLARLFQSFLVIYFAIFPQDLLLNSFIRPLTVRVAGEASGVRSVVNNLQVQR
jgi:hypothetical protein